MNFNNYYFKEEMLEEMLVNGTPKEGSYIVAFNKWIWALDEDDPNLNKKFEDIYDKIPEDVDKDSLDDLLDTDDVYDFMNTLQESVLHDAIIGRIEDNDLYLQSTGSFIHDPKSSILVKKVVKQLGVDSVSYVEDLDSTTTTVRKYDIKGKIPNEVYHGTSSKYLPFILRVGLHPNKSESNYLDQNIVHPDKVFFTTRIGEAMSHAVHTSHKQGGVPVILTMKIPDRSKIIADFDIEDLTGQEEFYNFHYRGERKVDQKKPMSLSKEFGVYGYKGNIKPSFIDDGIWVSTKGEDLEIYSMDDFTKIDKDDEELEYMLDNY